MTIRQELMIELKNIYNDKDFVFSTLDIAKTEHAWHTLLDFIQTAKKQGDTLTSDNIQLAAIHLRDEEDKKSQERIKRKVTAAIF